jgi:hypothetical protein
MRVLILGARAPVALDHARRFHRQGAQVFVADSLSCRLSSSSRSVRAAFALPPPRQAPREFAATLARIIQTHRIDLLLPTCEEVFYVSAARPELPRQCQVFAADFEQLRALHSKLRFQKLAVDCGARLPPSACVTSLAAARDWAAGRPLVLKPEYSRFGVHVRMYPQGMPSEAPTLPSLGDWVAQEYCAGRELCSYSIVHQGELRAHVAYEPRYRLARSSSYYFDPVDEPRIREFVTRFVHKIGFTGQISFDWIIDAANRLNVLECNPRAISGLHLFAETDALPSAIRGDGIGCVTPSQPAPRMIAAVMTGPGLVRALRAGTMPQWRRDYARARDVLWTPEDRLPSLGGILDLGAFAWTALRQGISVREAATRDIEWDGEAMTP